MKDTKNIVETSTSDLTSTLTHHDNHIHYNTSIYELLVVEPTIHTFPLHAHGKALLVAAVLAAIALAFVNQALFVIPAGIAQVFAHSSFEETFAPLTAVYTIVFACILHK